MLVGKQTQSGGSSDRVASQYWSHLPAASRALGSASCGTATDCRRVGIATGMDLLSDLDSGSFHQTPTQAARARLTAWGFQASDRHRAPAHRLSQESPAHALPGPCPLQAFCRGARRWFACETSSFQDPQAKGTARKARASGRHDRAVASMPRVPIKSLDHSMWRDECGGCACFLKMGVPVLPVLEESTGEWRNDWGGCPLSWSTCARALLASEIVSAA